MFGLTRCDHVFSIEIPSLGDEVLAVLCARCTLWLRVLVCVGCGVEIVPGVMAEHAPACWAEDEKTWGASHGHAGDPARAPTVVTGRGRAPTSAASGIYYSTSTPRTDP